MNLKPVHRTRSLLDELESTLTHGTVARRVETLQRVTDLFVRNALDFSAEQIVLFDDVFQCLIEHIEVSAKALLARRLAAVDTAPFQTMHRLAKDDAIEVAGPVLSKSERLDDDVLIETARTKSQAHLLAISIRRVLSRAVTDVLLLRGNDEVVRSTAANPGAEFSEGGFEQLVDRAEQDEELADCLALRPNLPRHVYLKLVTKASETVRQRLEAAQPDQVSQICVAVRAGARRARSASVAQTKQTEIAHALVRSLHADGRLDGPLIEQFAEEKKFDEANAAIAALAHVSVDVAETIMVEGRAEGVMILGKVAGLPWSTVALLIDMRDALNGSNPVDLSVSKAAYERLRPSTAQQVLRFHRMQEFSASAPTA
ncbi:MULTISPECIES: DUF2336 domain-containing protein [unclassified Bradyrhizobium]|uniref:DUF2336 domain-containing protein n=1 Tax=unclassified Bradyrhizobium TaxID=2631580 RepID=UPI0028F13FAE|nr:MULTISPECIES: DUF2336 domain-containing protein [unclassified Bradyrhizobium]